MNKAHPLQGEGFQSKMNLRDWTLIMKFIFISSRRAKKVDTSKLNSHEIWDLLIDSLSIARGIPTVLTIL